MEGCNEAVQMEQHLRDGRLHIRIVGASVYLCGTLHVAGNTTSAEIDECQACRLQWDAIVASVKED